MLNLEDNISAETRLAHAMDALLSDGKTPTLGYAMSVIKNNKISFERQNGFRAYSNNPKECLPVDSATRYRIASVSKTFTAVAIMQLREAGLIDLDTDASMYLGFKLRNPNYPDSIITPRLLMAHYSSIRDGSVYTIPYNISISECFLPGGRYYGNGEHFALPNGTHSRGPGHYYLYSNLNYGILGTIIERITNMRFDRYMREHVLLPMGIKASFNLGDFTKEEIADIAPIYELGTNGIWEAKVDDYHGEVQSPDLVTICNPDLGTENYVQNIKNYEVGTNGTVFSPQGGLRISAHELALYIQMYLGGGTAENGNRILKPESVEEMMHPVWFYQPELDNHDPADSTYAYGAGLVIISPKLGGCYAVKDKEDFILYGHTGSAYGLLSAFYFNRMKQFGFSYAFTGTAVPHENYPGQYSKRCQWHERVATAVYEYLVAEGVVSDLK